MGDPGAEFVFRVSENTTQQKKIAAHIQKYSNQQTKNEINQENDYQELSITDYADQIKQNDEKINKLTAQIIEINNMDKNQIDKVLQEKREQLEDELNSLYYDNIILSHKSESSFKTNLKRLQDELFALSHKSDNSSGTSIDDFIIHIKKNIELMKLEDSYLKRLLEVCMTQRKVVKAELNSYQQILDKDIEKGFQYGGE
jgi:small-conductance mechanosensitive channel